LSKRLSETNGDTTKMASSNLFPKLYANKNPSLLQLYISAKPVRYSQRYRAKFSKFYSNSIWTRKEQRRNPCLALFSEKVCLIKSSNLYILL